MFTSLDRDALFTIFDTLSLSSLVALRCTSRLADHYFVQYIANRLKITLARFILHCDDFLQEMATTSSVIGGSAAVAVVGRCRWTPDNLDVYVPRAYFAHFVAYLIAREGCKVLFDHLRGDLEEQATALDCYALRLRTGSGESIVMYRTPHTSALRPLAVSWGSHLMCYISATSICVAYPSLADAQRATLRPIRLLENVYPAGRLLQLIRKYEHRQISFRMRELAWDRELDVEAECPGAGSAYCPLTMRYLGDSFTVTAAHRSLSQRRLHPPPSNFLKLETLVWWEGGQACDEGCVGHGHITQPAGHILSTMVLPTTR